MKAEARFSKRLAFWIDASVAASLFLFLA